MADDKVQRVLLFLGKITIAMVPRLTFHVWSTKNLCSRQLVSDIMAHIIQSVDSLFSSTSKYIGKKPYTAIGRYKEKNAACAWLLIRYWNMNVLE
jgi:hypothetical protein